MFNLDPCNYDYGRHGHNGTAAPDHGLCDLFCNVLRAMVDCIIIGRRIDRPDVPSCLLLVFAESVIYHM